MSSIGVQKLIKDNSDELQDYLRDLKSWEKDIKKEEKDLVEKKNSSVEELPPIRKKNMKNKCETKSKKSDEKEKEVKEIKGTKNKASKISAYDYQAWDKFDVDKALESEGEEDSDQKDIKLQNQILQRDAAPATRLNLSESPKIETVSESNKERADRLKEEGNSCYSAGKLSDAIAKYTRGIGLNPGNPLLPANRAMAYIKMKKFKVAEKDCTRALQLDSNYIKAYLRRATTRVNLMNLSGAMEDYEKVLKLEPWNKDALREVEKLKKQTTIDPSKETEERKAQSTKKLKTGPVKDVETEKQQGNQVHPVSKPIQLQSTKPLVNVPVIEVGTMEDIQALLDASKSERTKVMSSKETDPPSPQNRPQISEISSSESIPPSPVSKTQSPETKAVGKNTAPGKKEERKPSLPKPPRTSHQFVQDWRRMTCFEDLAPSYLKSIPPSFFHGIEIEVDHLIDLFNMLCGDSFSADLAASVTAALMKSRGFFLNLAFLEAEEKKVFSKLLSKIKASQVIGSEELRKLKDVL